MSAPARPVTELPRTVPIGTARRTMQAVQRIRLHVIFGLVLLAFVGLIGRLVHVQLVHGDTWREQVESQSGWVKVRPVRGAILDRQGRPLAYSRPVRHVLVDAGGRFNEKAKAFEYAISDVGRFASTLSDVLDGSPSSSEIRQTIQGRRLRGDFDRNGSALVTLRKGIDDPRLITRLDETKLDGLVVRFGDRRDYPNGSWGGVVLGLARSSDAFSPVVGVEGVEAELDSILTGTTVERRVARDGRGRFIAPKSVDPTGDGDGRTVWLALDLVIQGYCEQALDTMCRDWAREQAVAIVLDPANGDILAMASRPSFDPASGARPEHGVPSNVATQALVEVGSTFKPFTAARALELGLAGIDEAFELPHDREFTIGGKTEVIHDSHDGGAPHGTGTLVDVISESNNPDVAELARRIGAPGMKKLIGDLGLLDRFPLAGYWHREKAGYLNKAREGAFDHLRWGFGHSVTQSPLRLAANFCAFARDDFRPVTPRLVLAAGGDAVPDAAPREPLLTDARKKDVIRRGLRACVTQGTASKSVLSPKYDIAGKTGTAKKPAVFGDTYYTCSFVGYAPADAPRLVCLVMALEPRPQGTAKPYGGAVAGPAVRSILERSLEEYLAVPTKNAVPEGGTPSAHGDAAQGAVPEATR